MRALDQGSWLVAKDHGWLRRTMVGCEGSWLVAKGSWLVAKGSNREKLIHGLARKHTFHGHRKHLLKIERGLEA